MCLLQVWVLEVLQAALAGSLRCRRLREYCVWLPPLYSHCYEEYTQGQLRAGPRPGHAPEGLTLWTGSAVVLVHYGQPTTPQRQQSGAGQVGVVEAKHVNVLNIILLASAWWPVYHWINGKGPIPSAAVTLLLLIQMHVASDALADAK